MSDIIIPPAPNSEPEEILDGDPKLLHHDPPPVVKHEENFEVVEKILRVTCMIAILVWFILMLYLMSTGLEPLGTFIGLSPVLATIVVTYILVDRYHMESGFLMVFPFIFTAMFFVVGLTGVLGGIDYGTLSVLNIIVGLFFEAVLVLQYSYVHKRLKKEREAELAAAEPAPEQTRLEQPDENPESAPVVVQVVNMPDIEPVKTSPAKPAKKPSFKLDDAGVKKLVSSIEDKAKAINAAIGRVYGTRKGGSESLRKKIRIDASHYNELAELKTKDSSKRRAAAVSLLRKIRSSLDTLARTENEVFDKAELGQLVRLKRNENGNDKIIDVLVANDSDPVKTYFDGAVEFCDQSLKSLS